MLFVGLRLPWTLFPLTIYIASDYTTRFLVFFPLSYLSFFRSPCMARSLVRVIDFSCQGISFWSDGDLFNIYTNVVCLSPTPVNHIKMQSFAVLEFLIATSFAFGSAQLGSMRWCCVCSTLCSISSASCWTRRWFRHALVTALNTTLARWSSWLWLHPVHR